MKKIGSGLVAVLMAGFLLSAFAGCASLAVVFSKGGSALNDARRALSEGRNLEAILYAIDSVKLDPKLVPAQEFLRDNFDQAQSGALAELAAAEKSADPKTLARRVCIYSLLVQIHSALGSLSLPFKDPSGKWEWTTVIRDYSSQLKAEKSKAFDAFFALGFDEIAHGKIVAAKSAFGSAINDYADESADVRFQARAGAASACLNYAQRFAQSYDTGELKSAIEAYKLALDFEPANAKARDGLKSFSLRLADVFASEGTTEEYKDQTDSLKQAVKLYEEALTWNPTQTDALWRLPRVKERLADRYYRLGRNIEDSAGRPDPDGAIAAYREAQKWVPNYLDTTKRIYMISVNGELAGMRPSLSDAGNEMARLYGRITSVSYKVDLSLSQIDKAQAIATKIAALEPKASAVLKNLSELAAGTSLARPVAELVAGFSPLLESATKVGAVARGEVSATGEIAAESAEKPSLLPLKTAITDLKTVTDRTKGTIEGMKLTLGRLASAYGKIADGISTLKSESDFRDGLENLRDLSRETASLQKGLRSMNGAFDSAESATDELFRSTSVQSAADSLATGMDQTASGLEEAAKDLESALGRKVTVDNKGKPLSLTVREILAGLPDEARPYEKQFLDTADSSIGPIRRRLALQLPRPTPFDEFAADLGKNSARAPIVASVAKAASDASLLSAQSEKRIAEKLQKLSSLTGYSLAR